MDHYEEYNNDSEKDDSTVWFVVDAAKKKAFSK